MEVYRDGQRIDFSYRPDGMRHSKVVSYPFKPSLNRSTTHFWDGQNIVLELNGNGVIKAKYLRGAQLIAQVIGAEAFYYLHNAHGDVVQRIAENGTSAPQYKYDAFGNQIAPSYAPRILSAFSKLRFNQLCFSFGAGELDPNPFRYCGEYFDSETEEYYLRARNYDPSTGRFTSADIHWNPGNMIYGDEPTKINGRQKHKSNEENRIDNEPPIVQETLLPNLLSIQQSYNLYTYCINNPIQYSDINGKSLFKSILHAVIAVAVVVAVAALVVATAGVAVAVLALALVSAGVGVLAASTAAAGAMAIAGTAYTVAGVATGVATTAIVVDMVADNIQASKKGKVPSNLTKDMTKYQKNMLHRLMGKWKREHGMGPDDDTPLEIIVELIAEILEMYSKRKK